MRTVALPTIRRPRPLFLAAFIALVVAVGGYVGVVRLTGGSDDTLLSQGRPVTASSTEGPAFPATAAVDGSANTRWSSQFSDPQWIQVDLGATASIDRVVLQWEAAYGKAFQLQVSTDTVTWTPIYSTTTGSGGTQSLDVTGSGRYVRMYGTARANGYGYSLWEFQVYGRFAPTDATCATGTNVALRRPATASSVENPGLSAASAVDGDGNTRWSSQFSDPQWIQVDLGASMAICQVVLTWEAAYGRGYQIQISSDAMGWTSIYSTAGGTGGTETLNVSGEGRYLRVYGTARGTGYGYSLWELAVHQATPSATPSPTVGPGRSPTPTPTTPANWTKVWGDDFTGTAGGALSADWTTDTGTGYPAGPANWGSGEVETMTNSPANVSLDGAGHAAITAVHAGAGWTSGRIESKRTDFAAPAGGQLQITATLQQPNPANGMGYWPAFRTLGAGYRANPATWPGTGEIDVMENVNGLSEAVGTLHCGVNSGGVCNEPDGLGTGLAGCPGCQTGYHTYSEIIDRSLADEQVRWYLDGQQIGSVSESQVGVDAWQQAVDHGFFIVFDLAMGGAFPNAVCGCTSPTAATSSGGTLSLDSVAVYTTAGPAPAPLTTPALPTAASRVQVTGSQGNWQLMVDGAPYQLKGLTFGPSSAAALAYLPDLKAMGVNTLRTWGTDASTRPLLDAAARYGVKVVNGFWLNQNADYVNDTAYKTNTLNAIVGTVNLYKGHPGVLMWDVGNEVLLTLQNTYSGAQLEQQRNAYAQFVDQVAQAIHAADPNHPVTSTDAWTGAWPYYRANSPHLDLYAVNSYGSACNVKQDWINGGYTKPYILTEGGPAGEWEVPNDGNGVPTEPTDQQKAAGYVAAWNCVAGHPGVALGATLFSYGIENDFGGVWFNLRTGGAKRLSYYAVRNVYSGQQGGNTPPVISSMTVPATASAGQPMKVSVDASDPNADPIRYTIMFSGKYLDGGTGLSYARFDQTGPGAFSATAPGRTGVWKVYVYAYDGHGNVGIETRSVRVVAPPVAGTNVALGKPTTASSYQATGDGAPFLPSKATDGNLATRWATDWSDPQWIQVDLGQATAVKHVQLAWESAYGKAYQIQLSNDGATWTTVYSTAAGDGGIDDIDVAGTGRYVRLYGTARGTPYGYSLYEFGVYA